MKAKKRGGKFNDRFLMKRRDPLGEFDSQLKLLVMFEDIEARWGEFVS